MKRRAAIECGVDGQLGVAIIVVVPGFRLQISRYL